MNKELLLKVADAIEANPKHFDMDDFLDECGTTACIAGWSVSLYEDKNLPALANDYEEKEIAKVARQILDVGEVRDSNEIGSALFYVCDWRNNDLRRRFHLSANRKTKAKIAAEYVRWFVATDGGVNS
jgi:hypothetical protein